MADDLDISDGEIDELDTVTTESDLEEPYCVCGEDNDHEMIGCDGPQCEFEWFHYACVGIDAADIPTGNFICKFCEDKMKPKAKKGKQTKKAKKKPGETATCSQGLEVDNTQPSATLENNGSHKQSGTKRKLGETATSSQETETEVARPHADPVEKTRLRKPPVTVEAELNESTFQDALTDLPNSPLITVNPSITPYAHKISQQLKLPNQSPCISVFVKLLSSEIGKCSSSASTLSSAMEMTCSKFHSLSLNSDLRKSFDDLLEAIGVDASPKSVDIIFSVFLEIVFSKATSRQQSQTSKPAPSSLSEQEEQALRYMCGYIPFKLLKHYRRFPQNPSATLFVKILEKWAIDGESESETNSLLKYTIAWISKVNRGRLFKPTDDVYLFFRDVENVVRGHLHQHNVVSLSKINIREMLVAEVIGNEEIDRKWNNITPKTHSKLIGLLKNRVLNEYVKLRCRAFCTNLNMSLKNQHPKTSKSKTKSLRKTLAAD